MAIMEISKEAVKLRDEFEVKLDYWKFPYSTGFNQGYCQGAYEKQLIITTLQTELEAVKGELRKLDETYEHKGWACYNLKVEKVADVIKFQRDDIEALTSKLKTAIEALEKIAIPYCARAPAAPMESNNTIARTALASIKEG